MPAIIIMEYISPHQFLRLVLQKVLVFFSTFAGPVEPLVQRPGRRKEQSHAPKQYQYPGLLTMSRPERNALTQHDKKYPEENANTGASFRHLNVRINNAENIFEGHKIYFPLSMKIAL